MPTKTKKPSGLKIARKGNDFTFSWTRSSNYGDGLDLDYKVSDWKKWKSPKELSKSASSKKVTISTADLKGGKSISFRIRGNDKAYTKKRKKIDPGWSDYATKSIDIKTPDAPSLSAEVVTDVSNQTKFSWSLSTSDTDFKIFVRTEWQSILTSSSSKPSDAAFKSSSVGWQSGTAGSSSEVTITEETENIAVGSHTRWFRVRSVGTKGNSGWVYSSHTYGAPATAEIVNSTNLENSASDSTDITLRISTPGFGTSPVDSWTAEYAIETPNADMSCPSDASWKEGDTNTNTGSIDVAKFSIDGTVGEDQCLFARVTTQHDNDRNVSYGKPVLMRYGKLANPTINSSEVDYATKRVTIGATNNSDVPESYIRVYLRTASGQSTYIGNIPSGSDSATLSFNTSETVYSFAVQAFSRGNEMKSETVTKGGEVPLAPVGLTANTLLNGSIRVTWDWTWAKADSAQIGWADHDDAWESTDEPETFTVSHLHASAWNISGLETGTTWYIRIRLLAGSGDDTTYGPWSDMISVDLTESPTTPTLTLSSNVVTQNGSVTAAWAYASGDGTGQAYAEICEATVTADGTEYGDIVARATSEQSLTILGSKWNPGTTHYLAVRVTSASGRTSDGWSPVVALTVANEIQATVSATSLVEETIDETAVTSLKALPLTLTASGAGEGGTLTAYIERSGEYHIMRPDESERDGYDGETVAIQTRTGDGDFSFALTDLIGHLDDNANYNLVVIAKDNYGQTATISIPFEVHWEHQPTIPTAEVEIDGLIAKITPSNADALEGDACDIYRLSADAPELIVTDAVYGTTYVDPYPAFGEGCGHRIVSKGIDGDYITSENELAWLDVSDLDGDLVEGKSITINFGGEAVQLPYNITLSNQWEKDFETTKYLGGSIEGDWNPAVLRTLSASSDVLSTTDQLVINRMRRLAKHAGVCHIRTPEGSSFSANVSVSESRDSSNKIVSFSLDVSAVDPEGEDGMTLEKWNELNDIDTETEGD